MRLVCPNCGAQYEVDDRVIPQGGRDVQCSNCGHTWFQRPNGAEDGQEDRQTVAPQPEPVEPEMTAQAPEPSGAEQATGPEGEPPQAPSTPEEEEAPEPEPRPRARRTLDDNLQEVLRQEAEREARVRAQARQKLETQEELGLENMGPENMGPEYVEPQAPTATRPDQRPDRGPDQRVVAAQERMARLRGLDVEEDTTASGGVGARRDLLPDIEEINSSLTSIGSGEIIDDFAEPVRRSGFGRGFALALLLALIGVALYLYAPLISEKVPALAGALEAYVEVVDKARGWVDDMVALALSRLQ